MRGCVCPHPPLLALVARPVEAPLLGEPFHQRVVDRGEVLDVGGGVRPLVGGERAAGPVGEAVALAEANPEDSLTQRGQ